MFSVSASCGVKQRSTTGGPSPVASFGPWRRKTGRAFPTSPATLCFRLTIDPNYVPGFVWERQYGFRVTKTIQHVAFGIAAENPQLLYTATLAGNTPYAVLGSGGTNGGLYNAAISTCSPSTSIVNYTNQVNGGIDSYLPVYKTVNACSQHRQLLLQHHA